MISTSRRRSWFVASAVALLWASFLAGAGAGITELGPWYYALTQPPWKPPDLWFGPAWTLIFTASAAAGVRAWMASETRAQRAALLGALVVNSLLNVAWSWLFFRSQRPDWALIEWVPLWLSIVVLVLLCWRRDRPSAALMAVYLAWVSFAGVLNLTVVHLNGPFR